jgi:ABC-type enterochelin transport system ATPase subunit
MDIQELDAIYRLTTSALVAFDRFPYPCRIGKRDRSAVGKWLDSTWLEVLGIHNHLYAVIQAERERCRDDAQFASHQTQ